MAIYEELISGCLYRGKYPGTYIWEITSGGLISGGLYPMTNIRGIISGGLISGAYISVYRFFKATVDKVPLKGLYVPELKKKTVVISTRRVALSKDISSGAILRLREAINFPKWYHTWVKLVPESFGMFGGP